MHLISTTLSIYLSIYLSIDPLSVAVLIKAPEGAPMRFSREVLQKWEGSVLSGPGAT